MTFQLLLTTYLGDPVSVQKKCIYYCSLAFMTIKLQNTEMEYLQNTLWLTGHYTVVSITLADITETVAIQH